MKDAPVEIHPYSSESPALFAVEAEQLQTALASWVTGKIEHVGSTAVPVLSAKSVSGQTGKRELSAMSQKDPSPSNSTLLGARLALLLFVVILITLRAWIRGALDGEIWLWGVGLFLCGWYGVSRLLGRDAQFVSQIVSKDDPRATKLTGDLMISLVSLVFLYGLFTN